ncbi:MAG: AAA family ATPase [Caldilineaceae bacterium]
MTKLVVRLLGGYQVELDREAVHGFETDKARALLAYLVVEADRPHRRETLAALLWPDRPEMAARANLRQALARVRRALRDFQPPFFLFITPTDVQFNTASDYTLDAAELGAWANAPVVLRGLLPEVYCADFLAGFAVPDSEAFQAWTLTKQEYYHRLAIEILDEQYAYFEGAGAYEQAAAAARLQLRLEPWLDEAHRCCMRSLALAGHREEALRQYELCVRTLRAELDVEPAASTKALYAEIRAGVLHAPAPLAPLPVHPSPAQPAAAHALQAAPTGVLVARADELGRLSRHLDAALGGEPMAAFVSGDAGSGKSALLESFAAEAMAAHPDLVVATVRCHPGGALDPFAPLRRLAELLFGDLDKDIAWRPANRDQVDRLQRATALALAALAEHGPGLIDTLVSAPSVRRRAALRGVDALQRGAPSKLPAPWMAAVTPDTRPESQAVSQSILFDQLTCTLAAIASQNPLLILLDDLHWVDEATANFLLHIGRELSSSRILLLGAYRSATVAIGRRAAATGEVLRHPLAAVVNELRLTKGEILIELDRVDGRAFVEAYVDREPNRLGAGFRDALYAQTGGHALFTVELLRNLQERRVLYRDDAGRWTAADALDWGALPARIEAAIAERIDHLPEACRHILSCASVLGDEFAGEVVAELAGSTPGEVLFCLSDTLARQHHLVHPEYLQRLGGDRLSIYRFTHHLFQKYVFDRLDPVERGQLHAAAAACLERQAGNDPGERERLSVRLAWHYEAGGLPLQAAGALYDAGRQAMRLSAFREALERFDHGLALLLDEPPSSARTELVRLLETARLGPQRNLEGIGAAEYAGTLARAAAVWASDAQGRPELMMLSGQAERLWAKGQFDEALTVAGRLLEQATQQGQEDFVALAHWCFGFIHIGIGNARAAQSHLNWLANWLSEEHTAAVRSAVGLDLAATSLAFLAVAEWWLGYPEKARVLCTQAIDGALARGDVYGQVFASAIGSSVLYLLRSEDATQEEWAERCRRLCQQHGIGMWPVYGEVFLGRVAVLRGGPGAASGIDRIRSAVAGWQAAGMAVGTGSLVEVLADSCLAAAVRYAAGRDESPAAGEARAGLLAIGLSAVDDVLEPAKVVSSRAYEPELHRLRGELLLARDGLAASGEALACFTQALEQAEAKEMLAWELRAAMSLVRLQMRICEDRAQLPADERANRCTSMEEARDRLHAVYARYTEGFDFLDLQEAAALLDGSRETQPRAAAALTVGLHSGGADVP